MSIREMREDDVPALAEMLGRAYREHGNSPESMKLRLRAAIECGVKSFVADDLAGMVLVYDYGTTSFVALMGVEPRRQRGGVGKEIMAAMCGWLDQRGLPSELYATPAGHGLYRRYGFVDAGAAGIWYGRGPTGDGAGVRVAIAAEHEAIAALDREAFGADRGPTFRAALANPSNAVFLAAGGYAIAQRAQKVLGPVVAADDATAVVLLRAASRALDCEHRVNAPVRDDVERMLRDAGYRRDRTTERMVRGVVPQGRRGHIRVALNLGQG